jgi:hypothetical protein
MIRKICLLGVLRSPFHISTKVLVHFCLTPHPDFWRKIAILFVAIDWNFVLRVFIFLNIILANKKKLKKAVIKIVSSVWDASMHFLLMKYLVNFLLTLIKTIIYLKILSGEGSIHFWNKNSRYFERENVTFCSKLLEYSKKQIILIDLKPFRCCGYKNNKKKLKKTFDTNILTQTHLHTYAYTKKVQVEKK